MIKIEIPKAVKEWVSSHKGLRVPRHTPGCYESYATSKTSDCWGHHGGLEIAPGIQVAVCQPSPRRKGDTAWFLYDFQVTP